MSYSAAPAEAVEGLDVLLTVEESNGRRGDLTEVEILTLVEELEVKLNWGATRREIGAEPQP
ncbi:MAG: hypothetical protein WED09_01395 [Homoserinimonas sp.]